MRNSYQLCNNGTLRVMYANGMGISFHTEPHILAGSVSPTIGRRNITLPTDNGLNSIEWRLRKEQTKGKITVFGRKLRVTNFTNLSTALLKSTCAVHLTYLTNAFLFFRLMAAISSPSISIATPVRKRFTTITASSRCASCTMLRAGQLCGCPAVAWP